MSADQIALGEMCLAFARVLLALWLIMASAHWIIGVGRFGPDATMPWAGQRGDWRINRARRRLSASHVRTWMGLQSVIAAALLFATWGPLACGLLLAALLSHSGFILLSAEHGASGADKIGLIGLAGTLIGTIGLLIGDSALLLAGFLVTGGQLLICYMVAGSSKLLQPAWRSGNELAGVMSHEIWGAPWAASLMSPGVTARAASWALMLGEALFPLATLLPEPWLIAALGAMFAFHVATAVVMRLTLFPWAFAGAYPAVLFLGRVVRDALA